MAPDRRTLRAGLVAAAVACSVVALLMSSVAPAITAVTGIAVLASGISFAVHAWRHRTIAVTLRRTSTPGRLAGLPVLIAPVSTTAFVAGLTRPEIYCGRALADELTPDELRAVALHERAHQLAHDPLRATLLAAVTPFLRRTTAGRRWLEQAAAGREIAADRYALDHGVRRSALASALLKVQPVGLTHAAAFTPAVELRLRALVDGRATLPTGRLRRSFMSGAAIGLSACVAMLHPVHALVGGWCC